MALVAMPPLRHQELREGIYFAAKSGRMCASDRAPAPTATQSLRRKNLKVYIQKWDRSNGAQPNKVLEFLPETFFMQNDAAKRSLRRDVR